MAKIKIRMAQLDIQSVTCSKCKGRGHWRKKRCPACHGHGRITTTIGGAVTVESEP